MRIRELLEGKFFKDDQFVSKTEDGREINFDLVEDLVHYLNHDDNVYRRHTYPGIAKCLEITDRKKKPAAKIFKSAVEEGYKAYIREYPIRELPPNIKDDLCQEVCEKLREVVCKDIQDGKYKD